MNMRPRALLAKVGLDGHDVGVLLLARRLSTIGFEVIYLGKRNRPVDVANAAVDEDVDVVGISSLSGGAESLAARTLQALRDRGSQVPVIFGGIAEAHEVEAMVNAGVVRFFGPDSTIEDVADSFQRAVEARASASDGDEPEWRSRIQSDLRHHGL